MFLIIVIQLYVDTQCRSDVRTSAQNLFAFITLGLAMPIGFLTSGWLGQLCNINDPAKANFRLFFAVPAAVVVILLVVYWKWFQVDGTPERLKADGDDGTAT